MKQLVRDYICLCRPRHWIKNAFVFAPLVFAGDFLRLKPFIAALVIFWGFCLAASVVYIFNDICDADADRQHPKKSKNRPIAANRITRQHAGCLAACLLLWLLMGSWILPAAFNVIWGYIILNMLYSIKLKHIAIVDIFCIAIGFVLRVYAGSLAIAVPLSSWMFITTLSIALFLASIKRQKEFERNINLAANEPQSRLVLKNYTLPLLKRYAEISAISSLMFYSFFVITNNPRLVLTIPIVMFGIFRYYLVVETSELGETPTDLIWQDYPLLLTLLAWLTVVIFVLWP